MNNPRTRVRNVVRSVIEDAEDTNDVVRQSMDRVMEDEELTEYLIKEIVKKEMQTLTAEPATRKARDVTPLHMDEPTILPVIPRKEQILIDMARMTRVELFPLAEQMEEESDKLTEQAAFVRSIAMGLVKDEKVSDRYTREDLVRARGLITAKVERRYFINQTDITKRAFPRKELG